MNRSFFLARQSNCFQLLHLLQDGQIHSGEDLAEYLGVSRAAIWKHIKKLQDYGLPLAGKTSAGYCLSHAIELLSEQKILSQIDDNLALTELEILSNTESTNSVLMQRIGNESIHEHIVLAEYQERGRGRRGNEWLGSYAGGIFLSLGWSFSETPNHLGLLSLYIGNLVIAALEQTGINDLQLKWPNDIYFSEQKLAGILIEMRGEAGGAYEVVIGIGINYEVANKENINIPQAWTDIASITETKPSRNNVVAVLIENLIRGMRLFSSKSAEEILSSWEQHDYLLDRLVDIKQGEITHSGKVIGIDSTGALIVEINEQPKHFSSGEVSVRVAK